MMKKFFTYCFSCLATMVLSIGGWAIGYYSALNFISKNQGIANGLGIIILVLSLAVIIAMIATNIVRGSKFRKKINAMNVGERDAFATAMKTEIEKDYQKAEKSLYKAIINYNVYLYAIIFTFFCLSFSIGLLSAKPNDGFTAIPFIIITVFLAWGIVHKCLPFSEKEKIPSDLFITEKDFPIIHDIIIRASQKVGFNKSIKVICTSNSISIENNAHGVLISLQAEEVACLTEEELYSIMLHEFAHYKNLDTHRKEKFTAFAKKMENSPDQPFFALSNLLFTNGFAERIVFDLATFEVISSREKEINADNFVKEQGLAVPYVNASAKASLFALYAEQPWKEITFDTYKEVTPCENYAFVNYNCFLEKMGLYGDKWHFTLKNELPARVDSHPTFLMRMQAMGLNDYTVNFNIEPGDYFNEQQKLLTLSSALMIKEFASQDKNDKEYYLSIRKMAYEERVEAMERYKKFDSEWNVLSDSELIECAQAYLFIDDKIAEKILLEVIARSNSSFACYILGCYYAREYNDDCIELFKKAAIDSSATDEAFSQLGKYALKTGNQKLLDEYRATVVNKNQVAEEEILETLFTEEGLIPPEEKHSEQINEITKTLCDYWGSGLSALYIAIRETQDNTVVYYIAIEVDNKYPFEKAQKAYEESCYFITRMSTAGKKFYLIFGGKEFNSIKRLKGSCIFKRKK